MEFTPQGAEIVSIMPRPWKPEERLVRFPRTDIYATWDGCGYRSISQPFAQSLAAS